MAPPRRSPAGRRRTPTGRGGGRAPSRSPRAGGHATRRPAQRPAQRRRSRQSARQPNRRPPGGLTGRAAVLGLVVCALVLSLVYPVKQYLAQRGELAQLQAQRVAEQARVSALEQQRRRLSDPAYIKTLARERLQYVMPGETALVVVDPPTPQRHRHQPAPAQVDSHKAWYSQLWDTVQVADGG